MSSVSASRPRAATMIPSSSASMRPWKKPQTSEVFDLKPTSKRPRDSVKSWDGEYPRTIGWTRHVGSGMSRPVVPEWVHRATGDSGRLGHVHARAVGQTDPVAGGGGTGDREVPRRRESDG